MDDICSDKELDEYYGSLEDLEKIREYGLVIAKQEARDEEIVEENLAIAKNLLKQNLSIENISLATCLTIQEIEKIKK